MPTLADIFAKCTIVDSCLVWNGSCSGDGRPYWRGGGVERPVRALVYELRHGPLPAGKMACWTCTTERCVEHVEAMTKRERGALSSSRGAFRTPERIAAVMRGQRKRAPKMTMELANLLRQQRKRGATYEKLAADFGIHLSLAHKICQNKAWHLPPVRVQVIPHGPGRYEVTGAFERAITRDWLDRRLASVSRPDHQGLPPVSSLSLPLVAPATAA